MTLTREMVLYHCGALIQLRVGESVLGQSERIQRHLQLAKMRRFTRAWSEGTNSAHIEAVSSSPTIYSNESLMSTQEISNDKSGAASNV